MGVTRTLHVHYMPLIWYYKCDGQALYGCYKEATCATRANAAMALYGATRALDGAQHWFYIGALLVVHGQYTVATRALHGCYAVVTQALHECYTVATWDLH